MATPEVKEIFERLGDRFRAEASEGVDAVFQFDITGDGGGIWNVYVKEGACQIQDGSHDSPTVTLSMTTETWLGITNRSLGTMDAFFTGKLKVSGDLTLAQRIPKIFGF